MSTENHILIWEFGTGDIGDDVIERDGASFEIVSDIEFEGDGFAFFEDGGDFVELGFDEIDGWDGGEFVVIGAERAAGDDEVAGGGADGSGDACFIECGLEFFAEGGWGVGGGLLWISGAGRAWGQEDERAFELVFDGGEFVVICWSEDGFALNLAFGTGGPGIGAEDECFFGWFDDTSEPGAAIEADGEFAPFFESGVFDTEAFELVAGPLACGLEAIGAGEPGPDAIDEEIEVVLDAGIFAFEGDDAIGVGFFVACAGVWGEDGRRGEQKRERRLNWPHDRAPEGFQDAHCDESDVGRLPAAPFRPIDGARPEDPTRAFSVGNFGMARWNWQQAGDGAEDGLSDGAGGPSSK